MAIVTSNKFCNASCLTCWVHWHEQYVTIHHLLKCISYHLAIEGLVMLRVQILWASEVMMLLKMLVMKKSCFWNFFFAIYPRSTCITVTFKLRLVYLIQAESFPMLLSQIGCGKRLQPIKICKKYLQYLKCLQEIISSKKNLFLLPNGKAWKKILC